MEETRTNRRPILRRTASAVATGGVLALAGCGDPGDGDGEGEGDDGGGNYREDELDPGSANDAGTAAGGSSAG